MGDTETMSTLKYLDLPKWQLDAASEILRMIRDNARSNAYRAATRGGWEAMPTHLGDEAVAAVIARHTPSTQKKVKVFEALPDMAPSCNIMRWKPL